MLASFRVLESSPWRVATTLYNKPYGVTGVRSFPRRLNAHASALPWRQRWEQRALDSPFRGTAWVRVFSSRLWLQCSSWQVGREGMKKLLLLNDPASLWKLKIDEEEFMLLLWVMCTKQGTWVPKAQASVAVIRGLRTGKKEKKRRNDFWHSPRWGFPLSRAQTRIQGQSILEVIPGNTRLGMEKCERKQRGQPRVCN